MMLGSKFAAALWCSALLLAAPGGPPQDSDARHAVVAGAVFRESGLSLPGATVTLAAGDRPEKREETAIDNRRTR